MSASATPAVFQRFFTAQGALVEVDKLRRYDIYAPVAKSDKQYSYGSAATGAGFIPEIRSQICRDGRARFRAGPPGCGSTQGQAQRRLLRHGHAAADPVGAAQLPGAGPTTWPPWRTNWAMPSTPCWLRHHSVFTAHACLPLAETASTFGEMMLVEPFARAKKTTQPCAAICSSARWTMPTPPSSARPSLPCSSARRTT